MLRKSLYGKYWNANDALHNAICKEALCIAKRLNYELKRVNYKLKRVNNKLKRMNYPYSTSLYFDEFNDGKSAMKEALKKFND